MAAPPILPLILLLCVSQFTQSFSQWNSPQNIEIFYPFSPPPVILPQPAPSSPPVPSNDDVPEMPIPGLPVPPPQRKSSTRAAVGRAIGVTAASTVVLSALLFFFLVRRSRRKRERDNDTVTQGGTEGPVTRPRIDNFRRFDGNVKGIIVDENGLDVLYWRNLQDEEARRSFKRQNYRSLKEEQRQEIKRIESDKDRKKKPPVQESPLLRGMSSSSQNPIWGIRDEDRPVIEKTPSISPPMAVRVEVRQDDSFKGKELALEVPPARKPVMPPLPPPPAAFVAAPVRKEDVASQPRPPLPSMAVEAVPARKAASPPPPPPPPMAVETVPARKAAAPPPPPPIPKNKVSPPPPPPSAKPSSNPIGEGSSTSSNGNGQVKLKPLHWDKVNPNVQHSMVWDKMEKGSFKFDGDLMEALFGYVATNKKSPQRDTRSSIPGQAAQIFILDTRKSQNTAIVLKSLGVGRQEIMDALIDGHGLSSDTLEKLTRIAPTDEETSQILAFNGHPSKLAEAESFLYYLLKAVPLAFNRFHAMLFRLNYDVETSSIKDSLQSLALACKELRTRGLFLKLLEAVLKAGNRLNAGTARGNAQAFNLTALTKLSDVKSSDGKTTLLQFVVQEVVRAEGKRCVINKSRSLSRTSSHSSNGMSQSTEQTYKEDSESEYMILGLPVIGGLSAEFSNVKKAAALDYDLLVKTSSALAAQLAKIRTMLEQCGPEGGFVHEMTGFLDTAELEMKSLKEEQTKVMELVKKTTEYYQAGSSKGGNSVQLFVIVRDFLQMVDQVCLDIARNVQKRKHGSSAAGSSSSGSGSPQRVFRFPKLPANFMSDDSRSSLEDNDSEDR